MRKAHGFTLLELLITTAIFSIIILGVYSAFNTGLLSNQRIEASLNTYQTARRIFNRLNLDLKNAFIFSSQNTKFSGSNNQLSFFTLVASQPSLVVYSFEDGKLLRICKQNLESLKEDVIIRPRIIAKEIKEMAFFYAYPTQDDKIYDLRKDWDPKDGLPLAVKIELTLIEKLPRQEEKEIEFKQLIFLPLAG